MPTAPYTISLACTTASNVSANSLTNQSGSFLAMIRSCRSVCTAWLMGLSPWGRQSLRSAAAKRCQQTPYRALLLLLDGLRCQLWVGDPGLLERRQSLLTARRGANQTDFVQ